MRTPSASFSCECMNAGYTRHAYLYLALRDTDVKSFRREPLVGLKHARRVSFQRDRRAIWETSSECPSLREAIARTFRCLLGSQSCGFGKPATSSKLLLFQNLRLLSLAIRLICNINFREVDYPFCHRATLSRSLYQFLASILD